MEINESSPEVLYELVVGEAYGYEGKLHGANFNHTGIKLPIEKIRAIIEIWGGDVWEIHKYAKRKYTTGAGYYYDDVRNECEASPRWKAYLDEQQAERDEYDAEMRSLVEKFNALPEELEELKVMEGLTFKLVKSGKAVYDRGWSSKMREGGVQWMLNGQEFSLWGYITDDGRVLRKKFIEEKSRLLGVEIAPIVADKLKELQKIKWSYESKCRMYR